MKRLFIALLLVLVCGQAWAVGSSSLSLGETILNKPLVFVSSIANNPLADGVAKAASFSREIHDPDNLWDGVSTFTAPVDGIYKISGTIQVSNNTPGSWLYAGTFVNGVQKTTHDIRTVNTTLNPCTIVLNDPLKLSAGDKVSFKAYTAGSAGSILGVAAGGAFEYDTSIIIERIYPN